MPAADYSLQLLHSCPWSSQCQDADVLLSTLHRCYCRDIHSRRNSKLSFHCVDLACSFYAPLALPKPQCTFCDLKKSYLSFYRNWNRNGPTTPALESLDALVAVRLPYLHKSVTRPQNIKHLPPVANRFNSEWSRTRCRMWKCGDVGSESDVNADVEAEEQQTESQKDGGDEGHQNLHHQTRQSV